VQRPYHLIPKVHTLSYFGDELEGPREIPRLLCEEAPFSFKLALPDSEVRQRCCPVGRFPTDDLALGNLPIGKTKQLKIAE
jgi:hypothetical protein